MICTQVNDIKYSYLMQIIFKRINLTHRRDPNRYNHFRLDWNLGVMAIKGKDVFPYGPIEYV